mgnify:CR=1 FL=1
MDVLKGECCEGCIGVSPVPTAQHWRHASGTRSSVDSRSVNKKRRPQFLGAVFVFLTRVDYRFSHS